MHEHFLSIPLRLSFLIVFLLATYLIQRFWFARAWRLAKRVGRGPVRPFLQAAWFAGAALAFLPVLDSALGDFAPRSGFPGVLLAIGRLWLGTSFLALIPVKLIAAFNWTAKWALRKAGHPDQGSVNKGRREFFRYTTYMAGSLTFAAGAYGYFQERLNYEFRKTEIPIPGLPRGLDGMRIAQLSDIHIGDFMPRNEVRRAVDMANDLGADLTVVTGDFITNEHDPLEGCIAELSRLRAPLGVWGCNGNHEIYAGAEAAAQEFFARYGMRLLRQEKAELEWHGERFNLIGVDYQRERMRSGKKRPMLAGTENLVRSGVPNILLSHNPNSFKRAAELGIDLSLAGHTHGGQIRVEIVDHSISPARFMTDFVAGLYRLPSGAPTAGAGVLLAGAIRKPSFLYVNRGLGTIGLPVRLGVPPEITLITLRSAS
ncbi:MAG: metallophosphoesterase [Candidatus Acidiferrales bacterium]